MDKNRWQTIEEIFHAAGGIGPVEREDYVRRACSEDKSMYSEIIALLRESDEPSRTLNSPVFDLGMRILDGMSVDKRTGETLGDFQIGNLIGRGGMGDVYAAYDNKLKQPVALKFISEAFALDPESVRRFKNEARAASLVSHPNVAQMYELIEVNGENIIVMELVEGANLRYRLADPLDVVFILDVAIQVSRALVAAHSAGVVHRDIKPENIIVCPDGTVKVLDFGLAKLVEPLNGPLRGANSPEGARATAILSTEFGTLIGTPAYMSPEQIRAVNIDTQSDIWSLGVVVYELLTQRLPFNGPTRIDMIASILMSEPASLRTKTPALREINIILKKALSKEKSGRYLNANELLNALEKTKKTLNPSKSRAAAVTGKVWITSWPLWKWIAGSCGLLIFLIAMIPTSRNAVLAKLIARPKATLQSSMPITDGLVSYWPADGNADDLVGGNNGILENGTKFGVGIKDQAFIFDGYDDRVSVPDTADLNFGTADFTVSFFAKFDYLTDNANGLIHKDTYRNEKEFNGWLFNICDSCIPSHGLGFEIRNSGKGLDTNVRYPTSNFQIGIWYNITAVRRSNILYLYIDGVLRATEAESAPIDVSNTAPLEIGALSSGSRQYFAGSIGDVAIFNRALSLSEVQILSSFTVPPAAMPTPTLNTAPAQNPGATPVSYWPADGNANDVVGGNVGTLLNGAAYTSGVSGQAFLFDGIDDFFEAPTNGLPTGDADRTVVMWVKVDDFVVEDAFFGGYGTVGLNDQFYVLYGNRELTSFSNWGEGLSGPSLEINRWHHLAVTTGRGVTTLFIDGVVVRSAVMTVHTPADTKFYCGGLPSQLGDTHKLKGAVDEIAVYDRALSAADIQTLFSAVTPPNT